MRILILDTCGEVGSVALAEGGTVLAVEKLQARAASALLLPTVRTMLEAQAWQVVDLGAVGVVSGPGSFTGMRVGLAAAKGLCCATGDRLALVSQLEVMATAARLTAGCAALHAGRGEFYVRTEPTGEEKLCSRASLEELATGMRLVVAEAQLMALLADLSPEWIDRDAGTALPLILRELARGGADIDLADANYVRGERDIYARAPAGTDRGVDGL